MRVHFTGACGRAIGSLALDLQHRGWSISASDATMYAPMDKILREGGLRIFPKFAARQVPPDAEVLVRGSHTPLDNVEVRAASRRGIPVMHLPAFLQKHVLHHQHRIVIAGTNGKTTTTAMLAFILEQAGLKPDFLIGGTVRDLPSAARFRTRRIAVVEGDEYLATPDDPRPKFLFYKPTALLLTNLHYDHAEVYPDFATVKSWFGKLVDLVPTDGRIIVSAACPEAISIAKQARCRVEIVGKKGKRPLGISTFSESESGSRFSFGGVAFALSLPGLMNARNAAMAAQAALHLGVSLKKSAEALTRFRGVRGRMEEVVSLPDGRLILDEGYHPSAVRENLTALRQHFPDRKLIHIFQPRHTGGCGGYITQEMPEVLAAADAVILLRGFDYHVFPSGKFSDLAFARAVAARGPQVVRLRKARRIFHHLPRLWKHGAVVLCSIPAGCNHITDPLAEQVIKLATS